MAQITALKIWSFQKFNTLQLRLSSAFQKLTETDRAVPSGQRSSWNTCFPDDIHTGAILNGPLCFWFHQEHNHCATINVHFTLQMISGSSNSSCLFAVFMNEGTVRKTQSRILLSAWLLPAAHPNLFNDLRFFWWFRTCWWTWSKLRILTKHKMRQFSCVLLLFSDFPQSESNDPDSLRCNCRLSSIDFSDLWMAERTVAHSLLLTNQLQLAFSWLLSDLHVLVLDASHKGWVNKAPFHLQRSFLASMEVHSQDLALRLGCTARFLRNVAAWLATPGAFAGVYCSLQLTPGFVCPCRRGRRERWDATSWQASALSGQPQHALPELEHSEFRLA